MWHQVKTMDMEAMLELERTKSPTTRHQLQSVINHQQQLLEAVYINRSQQVIYQQFTPVQVPSQLNLQMFPLSTLVQQSTRLPLFSQPLFSKLTLLLNPFEQFKFKALINGLKTSLKDQNTPNFITIVPSITEILHLKKILP